MNLKKVLSAVLSVATLTATMSMGAMAESNPFNLMPANAEAVSGGTATMENGVLTLTAGAADTEFTWEINQSYDANSLYNMYFTLENTNGFNIALTTTAKSGDVSPSLSNDFGNLAMFGEKSIDQLGTLITTGPFVDTEMTVENEQELGWLGAYTWNDNVPDDGMITVKKVTVKVGANGTVKLTNFYMSDVPGAPAGSATNAPATDGDDTPATTAANNGTTTTKKTNPSTGESTAMVASGIVLAVVSAGAVALTMKKKAQ